MTADSDARHATQCHATPCHAAHDSTRSLIMQKPIDNGGKGPRYHWRQTSEVVQAVVWLENEDVSSKQIEFKCCGEMLRLAKRGSEVPYLQGKLYAQVKPEEAEWAIEPSVPVWKSPAAEAREPGRAVVITLEKDYPTYKTADTKLSKGHWPCFIKGHPTIDVEMLAAGELKLEDLY